VPVVCYPFRILGVAAGLLAGGSALAADLEVIYTTRAGDTLIGLEKRFLAAPFGWKGLKVHNGGVNPLRVPIGSQLRIPERWLRVEPRTARVVALQGDVSMDGRALALDSKVPAGALLRTGEGAFITLLMPDESRLTVQPQSVARFTKVQGFQGFEGQTTEVSLEHGRVETHAAAQRGPAARYQIRTPTATVSVRGTEFRVGADPVAHSAQAEVTGGEVRLNPVDGGAAKALPAGYGVVAKAGTPIPAPRPLLPAPTLTALPDRFERVDLSLPFAPVDKAVAYRAQIARDPKFADVVADAVFNTPPARFGALPDGAWWLRVRAIDEAGLEGFDAEHAFTLRARPEPPKALDTERGTLAWSPAAEAARYRLQIADQPGFTTLLADRQTAALAADPGLPAGRYQWRVASLRASGEQGPWSDAHSLVVRQAPQAASLTIYNRRMRFAWPGSAGQIYDVQLARDEAFTDLLVDQRIGEAALTVLEPTGGTYYLRRRATDPDGGTSPWSGVQTLRQIFLLPVWSLSAPAAAQP